MGGFSPGQLCITLQPFPRLSCVLRLQRSAFFMSHDGLHQPSEVSLYSGLAELLPDLFQVFATCAEFKRQQKRVQQREKNNTCTEKN